MKKTLLFLLLTVVGSVAFAGGVDNPAAANRMAVVRAGSLFKVFYKVGSLNKVTINIYDESGKKVFADNLGRVDNFVRPYNFSELKDGKYTIELIDASGRQVQNIDYNAAATSPEKLATLVRLKKGNSRYLLMVPSHEHGSLQVKIFDGANRVVYEETNEVDGDFSKVYDLKSLSGKFAVEITDDKGNVRAFTN